MKDKVFIKIVLLFAVLVGIFLLFGGLKSLMPVYYSFLNDENIAAQLNKTYLKANKKTEGIIRFPDMRCFSRNVDLQKNIVWKYEVGNKLKSMISSKLKENLKTEIAKNICRQPDYNYLIEARRFRFLMEYYDNEKNFLFSVPITSKECSAVKSMPQTRPAQNMQGRQIPMNGPQAQNPHKPPNPSKGPNPPGSMPAPSEPMPPAR